LFSFHSKVSRNPKSHVFHQGRKTKEIIEKREKLQQTPKSVDEIIGVLGRNTKKSDLQNLNSNEILREVPMIGTDINSSNFKKCNKFHRLSIRPSVIHIMHWSSKELTDSSNHL
jgi:hypothetical protein